MIPVGQRGRTVGGPITERFPTDLPCEWFVTVVNDQADSGGFFVLYENSLGTRAYDDWVHDRESLEAYFRAIGWQVEWQA
jgi:hypothetical protein